jgi:phage shock protein E
MIGLLKSLLAKFAPAPLPPAAERILLDVRTPGEYASGHLSGALSIPLDALAARAAEKLPDRSAAIVVYCQSGMRSRMACRQLAGMGYTRCINGGGIASLSRRL